MAKVTAPTVAAFELDAEQVAALKPKKGREAAPSPYIAEVQAAIDNGGAKALGIMIPEGVKGSKVVSDLTKAAKQLDVKLKIQNREDKGGFVAFTYVPHPGNGATEDETATTPDAE